MAITQLAIYNKALTHIGSTRLDALTDEREERYSLDIVYDLGAVDRCLEAVKPRFATKTAVPSAAATAGGISLAYTHTLPTNWVATVGLFSDAELTQKITRYQHDGNTILTDYDTVYLRYVEGGNAVDIADATPGFVDVLALYLAREISRTHKPQHYERLADDLDALIEAVAGAEEGKDPGVSHSAQGSALSSDWLKIYNDALLILARDNLTDGESDHPYRVNIDKAVEADLVTSVLEDTEWMFGVSTTKIEYDPDIDPDWGYQYAHELPADLLRDVGVFYDERMMNPVDNYTKEDGYIFCDLTVIYLKYVDSDYAVNPGTWPTYFRRLVAARIAKDTAGVINGSRQQYADDEYSSRKNSAMTNDAIQSPPHKIAEGSWIRSRGARGSRYN